MHRRSLEVKFVFSSVIVYFLIYQSIQHVAAYEKALNYLYRKAVSSGDIPIKIIRSNVRRVSTPSKMAA